MDLFPQQAEFIRWIEERELSQTNGLVDKSRDMGVTWLCAGYLLHRWLFKPGFKGAVGSRKEALVDTVGDPDSIFEKMRILLRNLPGWMLPRGFDWKKHDNFCKLINPANGATLTGEAGENIGRGGRNSLYFIDEAAFLERPKSVDAALSENTNVRIDVSTPHGMGNPFAQKRFSGRLAVFSLHWKRDPRKNHWRIVDGAGRVVNDGPGGTDPPEDIPAGCKVEYPWYQAKCKDIGDPVIVAQELDIDYTASIEGITIPAAWVRAAVNLNKRINMSPAGNLVGGLDVADEGNAETTLIFRRGPVFGPVHSRREGNTTDIANWALDISKALGAKNLNYDSVGVGAGVASTYKVKARSGSLGLIVAGINVGRTASDAKWPDGRTSAQTFRNLKAELWWIARRRFEKTYEYVELGVPHPIDELVSIPDHIDLIAQLSLPRHFKTETGKIQMETKKELRARGVASPDYAEAFMLTLASTPKPVRSAVGGDRGAVNTYKPR